MASLGSRQLIRGRRAIEENTAVELAGHLKGSTHRIQVARARLVADMRWYVFLGGGSLGGG